MRLKKDHSGYRSSGLWLKYQEPKEGHPRSKKNTKLWCKGKVGVEHVYKLDKEYVSKYFSFKIYKCLNCGKKKHL